MPSKPEWLKEWRKRIRIIDIIEMAYENNCDCEVCQAVRELGGELGEIFTQQLASMPSFPGGAPGSRRKRKRK